MTIDLSLVLAVACYLFESRLVGYRDLLFSLVMPTNISLKPP